MRNKLKTLSPISDLLAIKKEIILGILSLSNFSGVRFLFTMAEKRPLRTCPVFQAKGIERT